MDNQREVENKKRKMDEMDNSHSGNGTRRRSHETSTRTSEQTRKSQRTDDYNAHASGKFIDDTYKPANGTPATFNSSDEQDTGAVERFRQNTEQFTSAGEESVQPGEIPVHAAIQVRETFTNSGEQNSQENQIFLNPAVQNVYTGEPTGNGENILNIGQQNMFAAKPFINTNEPYIGFGEIAAHSGETPNHTRANELLMKNAESEEVLGEQFSFGASASGYLNSNEQQISTGERYACISEQPANISERFLTTAAQNVHSHIPTSTYEQIFRAKFSNEQHACTRESVPQPEEQLSYTGGTSSRTDQQFLSTARIIGTQGPNIAHIQAPPALNVRSGLHLSNSRLAQRNTSTNVQSTHENNRRYGSAGGRGSFRRFTSAHTGPIRERAAHDFSPFFRQLPLNVGQVANTNEQFTRTGPMYGYNGMAVPPCCSVPLQPEQETAAAGIQNCMRTPNNSADCTRPAIMNGYSGTPFVSSCPISASSTVQNTSASAQSVPSQRNSGCSNVHSPYFVSQAASNSSELVRGGLMNANINSQVTGNNWTYSTRSSFTSSDTMCGYTSSPHLNSGSMSAPALQQLTPNWMHPSSTADNRRVPSTYTSTHQRRGHIDAPILFPSSISASSGNYPTPTPREPPITIALSTNSSAQFSRQDPTYTPAGRSGVSGMLSASTFPQPEMQSAPTWGHALPVDRNLTHSCASPSNANVGANMPSNAQYRSTAPIISFAASMTTPTCRPSISGPTARGPLSNFAQSPNTVSQSQGTRVESTRADTIFNSAGQMRGDTGTTYVSSGSISVPSVQQSSQWDPQNLGLRPLGLHSNRSIRNDLFLNLDSSNIIGYPYNASIPPRCVFLGSQPYLQFSSSDPILPILLSTITNTPRRNNNNNNANNS